jgi:8-oxo-dGTP pyrophosphatase MutT (NUDIX family)
MSHHTLKDYKTEKGVPICLHENRLFRMMFNGYYHYLDAIHYGAGVITVPRFTNGDVLMIRLQRAPAIGLSLEFPRGGADVDKSCEEEARRELAEETGYSIPLDAFEYLGELGGDTATLNGTMKVYLVNIPDGVLQGSFDTDEVEQVFRITPAELGALVRSGRIIDGLSLASYALLSFHLAAR